MTTIALYNLKGGVGKTSAAVNLAYAAAADGFPTLVWDLDAQGAASFYLQSTTDKQNATKKLISKGKSVYKMLQDTAYQHLSILPADTSLRHVDALLNAEKDSAAKQLNKIFKSLEDSFDFLILDCPPGFSILADAIFKTVDILLMPVIPTTLSERTYDMVRQHLLDLGVVEDKLMCFFSMVNIRKTLHKNTMAELGQDQRFFQYYIPHSTEVERMGLLEAPLLATQPDCAAALSYTALWQEIKEGVLE